MFVRNLRNHVLCVGIVCASLLLQACSDSSDKKSSGEDTQKPAPTASSSSSSSSSSSTSSSAGSSSSSGASAISSSSSSSTSSSSSSNSSSSSSSSSSGSTSGELPVTEGLTIQLDAGGLAAGALAEWRGGPASTLHAEQADPAKRPTVVLNAINGRPAVRFDGVNDRLTLVDNPFSNIATPITVFAVFSSNDYQGHLIGTGADTAGRFMSQGFAVGLAANKPFIRAKSNNDGSWLLSPENVKAGGPQIIAASISNAGSEIRTGCHITRNTQMPVPANLATAHLGGTHDGAESFAGDIAEILIYNRALSADEQAGIWKYLADKYSIETPAAADADNDGIFDACATGAVYLKAPAISVTLEAPAALHHGTLANIIDAASATAADPHTDITHVWAKGTTVLLFDLQANYKLEKIHFWNYNGENFDTDSIEFLFLDSAQQLISQITVAPQTGFEDILAEDFPVNVSGVRYVRAQLTATNNEVEFQNIGFTAVLEGTEP